jgi:hypothetical protein
MSGASKGEISKEDIWNVLFFFDNTEKLKTWGKDKFELDEKHIESFSKIRLKDGYA